MFPIRLGLGGIYGCVSVVDVFIFAQTFATTEGDCIGNSNWVLLSGIALFVMAF